MTDTYTFSADGEQFSVDTEKRIIEGLIVPFGVNPIDGRAVTFGKGDIGWSSYKSVKLNMDHAVSTSFGFGLSLAETDAGIRGRFKVADGPRGDEALALAGSGVYDGLSVNLYRPEGKDKFHLTHVALTAEPAFDEARVHKIAATAATDNKEGAVMADTNEKTAEAPQDFSAVTTAITEGFAALTVPPREVTPAAPPVVKEELPYRFNGTKGAHSFLGDIRDQKFGNHEAATRLEKFLSTAFASESTADVASLNPVMTRPELYVDNLHYSRPLWNLVSTGTLDEVTAFIVPKFGSVTGNPVSTHTEGVEPTEFTISAGPQTITPTAMSGKAILNREVVDQGGNPKVDQIIWNEMVASYYDSVETAIADALATATGTEINLGAGATDGEKLKLLTQALAKFQFRRGGDRFAGLAADPSLYGLLTSATDDLGRPLLPTYGPTNADGSKRASMESVQIGSKTAVPAWALAVDEDASGDPSEVSYLFVPSSVYAWASAPQRINIEYQVKSVEVGIWGYKAAAVTRTDDVVPVDATTSDVAD